MSDLFNEPEDATPLTVEEQQGLVASWVTTRADLNAAEQDNIVKGLGWAQRRRISTLDVVTEDFSQSLHKHMFGDVWTWAGSYRRTDKNLGCVWWQVPLECAALFENFGFWIEHETFSPDELAVRLHHHLVAIHPFPNGNGRHSRLMSDLLLEHMGGEAFRWGGGGLMGETELRRTYIAALRAADAHDLAPLLAFARS